MSRRDDPEAANREVDEHDDDAVVPDPPADPTVPEADAIEQEQVVATPQQRLDVSLDDEVPEADALEQAVEIPDDPDEDRVEP